MIYIVRHGETDLNNAHVLQGRSDVPLNENGILQAKKAAAWFADHGITFAGVYCSPLTRAVQTAEIIAPGIPVRTDLRLIEMDYGPYEGTDLRNPPQEIISFFRDFVNCPAPEGMEQLSEVTERTGDFLASLKDDNENILISTHAIAMKGLLENLDASAKGSYWSKYIGNCSVYAAESSRSTEVRELYKGS